MTQEPVTEAELKQLREWFRTAPDTHQSTGAIPSREALIEIALWMHKNRDEVKSLQAFRLLTDAYSKAASAVAVVIERLDTVIALEDTASFRQDVSDMRDQLTVWPYYGIKNKQSRPREPWQTLLPPLLKLIDEAAKTASGEIPNTSKAAVIFEVLRSIGAIRKVARGTNEKIPEVPSSASILSTMRKHGELSKRPERPKRRRSGSKLSMR